MNDDFRGVDPVDAELFAVFNFHVRIGDECLGCRSMSPIGFDLAPQTRRRIWRRWKHHGAATCRTVRVTRALTSSTLLFDWASAVAQGRADARDVRVEQLDHNGEATGVGWTLCDAVPAAWHGPAFDALTNAVSEEAIDLRCRTVRKI